MSANGDQIGPYTITREIGRGGMGVVYLARDTKLDRDVAIKALPPELAEDEERLARFEREARTLAQLNHHNIAGIHGIEEQDGQKYLILEYVEGETLAERLDRGAPPIDESLEIAIDIASGVEAAHEAGVIHRDLKPDNIKLTPDGQIKVLDFGLARVVEPTSGTAQADIQTLTSPTPRSPTIPGAIMGTAPYMSPEQARGKHVDKRTDIWSFGCVLYEMLTAERLFEGETASDSIAAILERALDFSHLPATMPPRAVHVLDRCLEKDPRKRLRDIGDARLELESALEGREWAAAQLDGASPARSKHRHVRAAALLVLGAILGGTAALIGFSPRDASSPVAPMRFELPLVVEGEEIAIGSMAISPDGTMVVIAPVGGGPLVLRDLGSIELRALPGTENAEAPFFSPDGGWIAFYQGNQLLRIPREGGPALAVADARGLSEAGVWVDDRTILDIDRQNDSIWRIDLDTGKRELLAEGPAELGFLGFDSICVVPGRHYVLVAGFVDNAIDAYRIVAISLDGGSVREVMRNGAFPMVAAGDEIVFLRESSLYMAPFDAATGTVTGPERLVLAGVASGQWGGDAAAALSRTGTLVYLPGDRLSIGRRVVRVSPSGETEPVTAPDALNVGALAISPDGGRIVFNTLRRSLEARVFDVERGGMQLIAGDGESYDFQWSPDGTRLAYFTLHPDRGYELGDVVVQDVASGARPQTVATHAYIEVHDWFPDGKALLVGQRTTPDTSGASEKRLLRLELNDPGELIPVFDHAGWSVFDARFSPDGRLLAYVSEESGHRRIHIRRYPELDRAWPVSFGPSSSPYWSPDSATLYWVQDDQMMKASITAEDDGVSITAPVFVFASPWPLAVTRWQAWEIGPDGAFYTIAPAAWEQAPEPPRIVLNFIEEVRR